MSRFGGKVALVAGGAAGIGRAAAERIAHDGASVVVSDIDLTRAQAVVTAISAAGGTATPLFIDLADEESVKRVVEETCSIYGGLDYLVNSGFTREHQHEDGNVVDTRQEVWDRIIDVNLMGFVRTCRHAIPRMIERGGGSIVNMTGGERHAVPRLVAYLVSKWGISALTQQSAVAFGSQGIRVNAIAPNAPTENTLASNPTLVDHWIDSSPLGRLGRPEEVASTIAYLLSDDASLISGEVLYVDGGTSIADKDAPRVPINGVSNAS